MTPAALRVVGIGGLPATGKSTLVRSLVSRWGSWPEFWSVEIGLAQGCVHKGLKLLLLGDYAEQMYPGTDKLSMAAQPDVIALIREISVRPEFGISRILFEGDRLFTQSFIEKLREDSRISLHMMILTAAEDTLKRRRRNRLSFQDESWIAGRATKLSNLLAAFPDVVSSAVNGTADEAQENAATVMRLLDV